MKWALCDLILKSAEHSDPCEVSEGCWVFKCFGNGAEMWLYELCFMLICLQNPTPVFKDARQEENPF